jgi:hypothetical protein
VRVSHVRSPREIAPLPERHLNQSKYVLWNARVRAIQVSQALVEVENVLIADVSAALGPLEVRERKASHAAPNDHAAIEANLVCIASGHKRFAAGTIRTEAKAAVKRNQDVSFSLVSTIGGLLPDEGPLFVGEQRVSIIVHACVRGSKSKEK